MMAFMQTTKLRVLVKNLWISKNIVFLNIGNKGCKGCIDDDFFIYLICRMELNVFVYTTQMIRFDF